MAIIIFWDPPIPPGHTNGYRIDFTKNPTNAELCTALDNITNLSDTTTITLTGLTSGCYYTVFINGLSEHLPSKTETATIFLGMCHSHYLFDILLL